jgi:hypothetical protein
MAWASTGSKSFARTNKGGGLLHLWELCYRSPMVSGFHILQRWVVDFSNGLNLALGGSRPSDRTGPEGYHL